MMQCFDKRNRLQRGGTSQAQRRLAALDPASAPVDERGVEDFLAFALRFSQHVVHFDTVGRKGTWEPFFACDASAIIAAIEKENPQPIRNAVRATLAGPAEPESLVRLFELLGDLAQRLEDWLQGVGTATDYRNQIRKRIRANLTMTLCRLVKFNLAAVDRFAVAAELDFAHFSDAWALDLCEATPDNSLFGDSDAVDEQIVTAMGQLETLFVPLYNVFLEVIGLAPLYFDEDLAGRKDHEPHFALFVAFLRLYLVVRDDANNLTQRHLDFFYEKVLGIEKRAAEPDHLHVLVELSRQVKDDHLLVAGTELDAGKDETGVPLLYAADEDLVASKAQVESFKTVFVEYDREAPGFPDERLIENVTAAPIANSQDGLGAEIEDTERPSWKTLGSAPMPGATLGFALASRSLLLAEGTRTITLELHVENLPEDLTEASIANGFEVLLSGEKGWIAPDSTNVKPQNVTAETEGDSVVRSGTLKLVVILEKTSDAVTYADAEALGEDFGTTLPVLKVTLHHPTANEAITYAYQLLKDLTLQKVTLSTNVIGMTNIIVQNDDFAMDPSKPFVPFGSVPRVRSSFYVGSQEAFQKKLTNLTLHGTWDGLPDEPFSTYYEAYDVASTELALSMFTVESSVLQDGEWSESSIGDRQLFRDGGGGKPDAYQELVYANFNGQEPRVIDELTEWTPATRHGFLRLTLSGQTFLHDDYVNVMTLQALATARLPDCTAGARYREFPSGGNVPVVRTVASCPFIPSTSSYQALIPNTPYTPTIKAFTLDYEASIDTESTPEEFELFHIEPFGKQNVAVPAGDQQPYLLPQYDHEGTLYLGVCNLKPRQSLAILFQVAEATADTDVAKPKVYWAYLANDDWIDFEEHEITGDTTRGLITSGVVNFSIPRGITSENTRLPSGVYWIRAHVDVDAGGVSELINAHGQAVRATFVDQGNDPKHLEAPLEAGKVGGLVRDDVGIAGIEQPYDSFGARPAETGLAFYTRVAEHLRHKGRAITLFDYERLVLESFPSIYKVKCINHTDGEHALSPGHVLIAVIPDFTQLMAIDRRRPKVTLDDLDEIAVFLQAISCPFVRNDRGDGRLRLHVLNPIYEEVRVGFNVRFQPDVSAVSFYGRELNDAINRFLSPWAFTDGADISFGGKVYKSSILNFVEQQPYVDYVTDFVMTHRGGTEDLDAIEADTPRSILVPAETHDIQPLPGRLCPVKQPIPPRDEVGHLTVNHDFEVAPMKETP